MDMASRLLFIVEDFLQRRNGRVPAVNMDDNLLELGLIDSNDFFDLLFSIEEELGIAIDLVAADPADLVSVAGLSRYLARPCAS